MAKLLTYDGQVIDPTAYIYIHTHVLLGPEALESLEKTCENRIMTPPII